MRTLESNAGSIYESAVFFNGFGADDNHLLAASFKNYAAENGIDAHVASIADVEGDYNVVVPVGVQVARAEGHLESDLILAWSAGAVAASYAFEGREAGLEQYLVLANPSVRTPKGFMDKYGRFGDDITQAESKLAADYGGIACVLPNPGGRLVAVSAWYYEEATAQNFEPGDLVAGLLSEFSVIGLSRARILKVAKDHRLGPDHPKLMDEMRQRLDPRATVKVDTIDGTHFFSGIEDDVMANILSGAFFSAGAGEIWARARVTKPAEALGQ